MRYFSLILLFVFLTFPTFAEDDPDIKQVARFGRGTAYTLAWRPDGEVLAVGSATGVWFFDEDFNELGRLAEDTPVDSLEWSPDGERLITVKNSYQTENCQLIVWNVSFDIQTSSQDKVFDYCAESVDWSADGELIAIGIEQQSQKSIVFIVSSDNYEIVSEYSNLGMYVAFSPNSRYLAINQNYDVQGMTILDISSNSIVQKIQNPEVMLNVAWSPDSQYISSTCNDYKLFQDFWGDCIWDITTGELVFTEEVSNFMWHPHKNIFLAYGNSPWGDTDRSSWLAMYDVGKTTSFETYHLDTIRQITWHPSGEHFTALTQGQRIVNFSSNTGEVLETHSLFGTSSTDITWIPETNSLLAYNNNQFDGNVVLNIWSIDAANHKEPFATHIIRDVDEIQWIENSEDFVVYSRGGLGYYFINIWNSDTFEQETKLWEHFEQGASIPYIRYSPDLEQIAYYWSDFDDEIIITGDLFQLFQRDNDLTISFQADSIRQIEWSPDDSMIATAGIVGELEVDRFLIEVWDATTGEKITSIPYSFGQGIPEFKWSPDGNHLAVFAKNQISNSQNGGSCHITLDVYNIGAGNSYPVESETQFNWEQSMYPTANCYYIDLAWSPDGQFIAFTAEQKLYFFAPYVDTEPIITIETQRLTSLDWHKNGKYLAGGASDGTIYVWDVSDLMEE